MRRFAELLRRPGMVAFLVFTGVYALALAFIFWGAWSMDAAPVAPDCATVHPVNDASAWLARVWSGSDFVPSDLMHVVGGMYFWQELQFALAAWLAALGVAYYLRGRGLSLVAAYGGGGAFGLMGYSFTLFSAGHLGWFIWLMYGPFAFGLADRCVREGGWVRWALLGAVLAWGSARQPDLWLLFTLLTFAYGVWCIVRERRALFGEGGCWRARLAGVGVCAAVALVVGAPQFGHAIFHDLAGREAQIDASSSSSSASAEDAAAKAKKAEERWLFCTSWSLPPEDTLEFAFAEIHGGSNDPRIYQKPGNAQYKGRLGQHGIVPEGAGGMHPVTGERLKPGDEFWMPYRQHSLYFGLLTVLFAIAGVVGAILMRRRSSAPGRKEACGADFADAPFWIVAGTVSYLCALGAFTPFYRLVYALPFGDTMRCPVKFVHLVEFCAAALAGYGIEFLRVRFGSRAAWVAGTLAVLATVNVLDLARVDAKYLAVQDVSFARAANDAAEDVAKLGGGNVFVALAPQEGARQIDESLTCHLAKTVRSGEGARFLLAGGSAFRADPSLDARMRSGELKLAGAYSVSREKGVRRADVKGAALLLLQDASVPAPAPEEAPSGGANRFLGLLSLFATIAVASCGAGCAVRRCLKQCEEGK